MADIIITIEVATDIISSILLCAGLGYSTILYRRLRRVSSIGLLLSIIFFLLLSFNVLKAIEYGASIPVLGEVEDMVLVALGAFLLATAIAIYYQLPVFPRLIRAAQQKDHRQLFRWLKAL
ncbi:hypothetical protein HY491_01460 [Candidatus Woesearchaeota archaeon]|nr:hypothetical protein [Candidatus Woesearchaeota archaeon]